MCHPAIAVIATVVSTAMSVYAAKSQADAQQDQADYESKVQQNNALIAEQNAQQREEDARKAQDQAAGAAAEHQMKTRRLISSQIAASAGSGLLTDTGTPLDILTQSAQFGAIDAGRIRENGAIQANGLLADARNMRVQKNDFLTNSVLKTWQGQAAQAAGANSMIGAGLSGASKAFGQAYTQDKNGNYRWFGKGN